MVRTRLSVKVLSLFVAVAVLVTLVAVWVTLGEQNRIVLTEQSAAAQVLIQTIDEGLTATMLSGNKDVARKLLDDMTAVPGISSVAVYRADGSLWHVDAARAADLPPVATASIVDVATTGRPFKGFRRSRGAEVYQVMAPIPARQACYKCHQRRKYLGVVAVVTSTAAVRARMASENRLLIGANLATAALGLLVLGLALAVFVVRPIARLATAAGAVKAGDLQLRVPVESRDEIGTLAGAFNEMTERLREKISDLEETRSELRETIERVGEAIRSAHRMDELTEVVAREAARIAGVEAAAVLLFDKEDELRIAGARGLPAAAVEAYNAEPFNLSEPEVRALAERRLSCGGFDPAKEPELARIAVLDGAAWLCAVTIKMDGQALGFITLVSREEEYLSEDARRLLASLAGQAAVAIQQIRLNDQAKILAVTDGLTGLYNHRYFQQRLASELHRSERFSHPLSLLMLDIDHFKLYNDQLGHLAGDMLLENLGAVLRESTRRIDTAARYGGEEFTVVLVETGYEDALAYAERLRVAIESLGTDARPLPPVEGAPDASMRITVSIGVATFPQNGTSPEEMIGAADRAMYRAKAGGRARVVGASA